MTVHLRIHTEKGGMLAGLYPEAFQFPGGEWHLRNIPEIPQDQGSITFIADWRGADPNDLVKAAMWIDVLDRLPYHPPGSRFVLMMPYVPAARADRGTPLGVTVYARLVRSLMADCVISLDPHSPQAQRSYSRSNMRIADVVPLIEQAVEGEKFDFVIAPDKGAHDRANAVAEKLKLPLLIAEKHRDFDTGKITSYKLDLPSINDGMRYLVVDDICDGGRTFKELAKVIEEHTGTYKPHIGLWVTHGIFSGNAHELRDHYNWIGTTDSHPGCFRPGVATTIVPCFDAMYNEMRK